MHITLVSPIDIFASQAGGTRAYVKNLAERLIARGVPVCVVMPGTCSRDQSGMSVATVRRSRRGEQFLARLATAAPSLPIPRESVIHAQRPDSLVAFYLAKRDRPSICTLHGIPSETIQRRRGQTLSSLYRILESQGLKRADRAVAVNHQTAQWYSLHYPRIADRVVVIPVAVDTDQFRPLDRSTARRRYGVSSRYAVLYAGRLSLEKRVDLILRAIREVPDTELLIAGHGPEEVSLRDQARGLPVRFLGIVPHEEMPWLVNASDALVLASENEGLPTAALEALACGIPVAAPPVGSLPDLIARSRTGWLVMDAGQLGSILRNGLREASEMQSACRAAVQPYSWEVVFPRILNLYREVSR